MASEPSTRTLKILFAQSRNRCAAPDCQHPVIADATSLDGAAPVAQVAHIVARNPDGPRGDPNFPPDQLHDEANLILLCGHHHALVDAQNSTFTVEELRRWKAALRESEPAARHLVNEATEKVRDLRRDEAAALFEQATEATDADDEVKRIAHLGAARSLLDIQVTKSAPDPTALRRIDQHLKAAKAVGARQAQLLATRAWVARLREEPAEMLDLAKEASTADDATPTDRADAIHAQLDALTALSEQDEAVELCRRDAQDVLDIVEGDGWLQLGASRLIVLAGAKAPELADDTQRFVQNARRIVPSPAGVQPLEIGHRLAELAAVLATEDCVKEALAIGEAASR